MAIACYKMCSVLVVWITWFVQILHFEQKDLGKIKVKILKSDVENILKCSITYFNKFFFPEIIIQYLLKCEY